MFFFLNYEKQKFIFYSIIHFYNIFIPIYVSNILEKNIVIGFII